MGTDVFLVTPTGLAALPVTGAAEGAAIAGAPGADAVVGVAVGDEDEEVLAAAGFALLGLAVRLMAGSVSTFWKMRGSARVVAHSG